MYPNPQDVLPLPPSPDLGNYRKRAKDLSKAARSAEPAEIEEWARRWIADLMALQPESRRGDVERHVSQVVSFARERLAPGQGALTQAQFVIARAHGFESWPKLVRHLEELAAASSASVFEQAADAIVRGDDAILARLLREHPELVRARSDREHRATLLHYVSANGVENYRQETPPNIVAIARRLLDAGAEVDAGAHVYAGNATTLYLVVTSAHPRTAGVQTALADLLLERGARLGPGIVRDCLANGCPEAARHLVLRGAPVSLEEAAGLGDLDTVRRLIGRTPGAAASPEAVAASLMAAWYDQREVIALLLDAGVPTRASHEHTGETLLHVAAYQGFVELVRLLLRRGADATARDDTYGTQPIDWALQGWLVDRRPTDEAYRAIVRSLLDAGSDVRPKWLEFEKLRSMLDVGNSPA